MKYYWVDLPVPVATQGCSPRYEPLEWAKANCASYIYMSNDAMEIRGEFHYRFYFTNNQDRVWFALRWS
jgi:hypothetical protein